MSLGMCKQLFTLRLHFITCVNTLSIIFTAEYTVISQLVSFGYKIIFNYFC